MADFRLVAPFEPTGDQPQAIERLADGVARGLRHQVLLGATGTGKSLAGDEPVLIGREDAAGQVSWTLEPIGQVVDAAVEERGTIAGDEGAEVAFAPPSGPRTFVVTIDPATHRPAIRPVTAWSRHPSPDVLWRVATTDGRQVTVTGDHNFVRLGSGARLEVAATSALRPGDRLPLPAGWPEPAPGGQWDLLLTGYFEENGSVDARRGAVVVTAAGSRLAGDLAWALLRLGIVASLAPGRSERAGGAPRDDLWRLEIRGAEDLAAFGDRVGFADDRRRTALAAILARGGGRAEPLPPVANELVGATRRALRASQAELAGAAGIPRTVVADIETGRRRLRRDVATRLLGGLRARLETEASSSPGASDAIAALERLLACRWTRVAEVRPVAPSSAHVYDLSVAGTETFLAGFGGLIVHNTYTIARVIEQAKRPTLVLSHNKTLAAQLYAEFRDFFPDNAVEYFVSYFDYYQPEAYLPRSDTYIEKDSSRNEEIDKLRHAATKALFERRDAIIVASVSCIYGLGAPIDYGATVLRLRRGAAYRRDSVLRHLVDLQYQRNDQALQRSRFRVRGDTLELVPAAEERLVRVEFFGDEVERITEVDPLTGELLAERNELNVFPASHFVTPADKLRAAVEAIGVEMEERVAWLEEQGRALEAARLRQRTAFDLEMIRELGFCSGIENYSRHLAGREAGSRPWTLLDYFPPDWLLVVDESHMTIPQVVGMYKNDRTRKEILVDFGFRLPSALDNRPLTFEEFEATVHQAIYMSATPGPYELERSERVVEQLIRPTGIVDPAIVVRPTEGQIDDLLERVRERVERGERVIVTTLTKRMAEDLADYLRELAVKVQYLHSEVDTLERVRILRDLRLGVYDVVVGINLLREGIDLPEVTLVAILDADKEGFLRSAWSLIQMIGRAARNVGGEVVMYADTVTESMRAAIEETNRRRAIQERHNRERGVTPLSIVKEIRDINDRLRAVAETAAPYRAGEEGLVGAPRADVEAIVARLEAEMRAAARELEFERAAALRDEIRQIRLRVLEEDASLAVGRAAEAAARRPTTPARSGRPGARGAGEKTAALEVTEVKVVAAVEEPSIAEGTAADWLPGLRDEHDDEGSGWQARWLDRPTWDRTVTPNVKRRTGRRSRPR